MVGLPDRKGNDRQRRIAGRTAGELAAVGDEQVLDVVSLPELVHHANVSLGLHSKVGDGPKSERSDLAFPAADLARATI